MHVSQCCGSGLNSHGNRLLGPPHGVAEHDLKPNFVPFEVRDSPVKQPVLRTPLG